MRRVGVATDSASDLAQEKARDLGITVVPLNIHLGKETFRDGIDITPGEFFRKILRSSVLPTTSPPPRAIFEEAFSKLAREVDDIISIHTSSKLSGTYEVAKEVAGSFISQCHITVMDSMTTSFGLATLAVAAAQAAQKGANLEEIVRLVRGMIPHIYLVFSVETLEYLERGGRISRAQALLGSMLGVKPLLIIEDGEIQPLEKVRTMEKAVEKLFEFITEFPHIEKMTVIHGVNGAEVEELLQRIEATYPEKEVGVAIYGPALAVHVGPGAMGVFVYEGM